MIKKNMEKIMKIIKNPDKTDINIFPRKKYLLRRAKYLEILPKLQSIDVAEVESLTSEIDMLQREKELFKENLIRLKAEFENFRKRVDRDKKDLVEKANEALLKEILTALDQFDLAMQAIANSSETNPFIEGMKMVHDNLLNILSSHGLKKINALGEIFNPYYHEAIAVEKMPDKKENEIINVLREGYIYKNKVIRPSLVRVVKNN